MPEADPPLAENRPFRSGSRLLSVEQARQGGGCRGNSARRAQSVRFGYFQIDPGLDKLF